MSVGSDLQSARVALGMSVEDVSNVTRIRPVMIEAIEADDFSLCGGVAYAKGQVRSIAMAVGLDPDEVMTEFPGVNPRRSVGAIPEEITEPAEIDRQLARRTSRRWVMLAGLVVIVAGAFVIWRVLGS